MTRKGRRAVLEIAKDEQYVKVCGAIRAVAGQGIELSPDSALYEDLGFDSVMMVELVVELQETHGVVFPDELVVLVQAVTVRDLWEHVLRASEHAGDGR